MDKETLKRKEFMKGIFRQFFNPAFDRLLSIRQKQAARLQRVIEVKKELDEWQDIPISHMINGMSETLGIIPNQAAKQFLMELCIPGIDIEKLAKKIPLKRQSSLVKGNTK